MREAFVHRDEVMIWKTNATAIKPLLDYEVIVCNKTEGKIKKKIHGTIARLSPSLRKLSNGKR